MAGSELVDPASLYWSVRRWAESRWESPLAYPEATGEDANLASLVRSFLSSTESREIRENPAVLAAFIRDYLDKARLRRMRRKVQTVDLTQPFVQCLHAAITNGWTQAAFVQGVVAEYLHYHLIRPAVAGLNLGVKSQLACVCSPRGDLRVERTVDSNNGIYVRRYVRIVHQFHVPPAGGMKTLAWKRDNCAPSNLILLGEPAESVAGVEVREAFYVGHSGPARLRVEPGLAFRFWKMWHRASGPGEIRRKIRRIETAAPLATDRETALAFLERASLSRYPVIRAQEVAVVGGFSEEEAAERLREWIIKAFDCGDIDWIRRDCGRDTGCPWIRIPAHVARILLGNAWDPVVAAAILIRISGA